VVCAIQFTARRVVLKGLATDVSICYLLALWELALGLLARARQRGRKALSLIDALPPFCTAIVSAGESNMYTSNGASQPASQPARLLPYLFLLHSCTAILSAGEQTVRQEPMLLFPSHYLPPRVGISIHLVAIQCLACLSQILT
jgi:hypothetical protein